MTPTKESIIESIVTFYEEHGRAPISNKDEIAASKRMVQTRFGNWNDALIEAGVPLNSHKAKTVTCTVCGINFVKPVCQIKRSINNFCSSRCSCTHRNTGRPQTAATKRKISEALKARNMCSYPCMVCGNSHSNRKRKTCSKDCLRELKQSHYKKN